MKNGFKFWSLAIIVALVAGFASCKKEKEKEYEPSIEGKWQLVEAGLGECNLLSYKEFVAGGKYREVNACKVPIAIIDGTWKKDGNRLTIIFENGDVETSTIDELTEVRLIISARALGTTITEIYKRIQ